MAVNWTEFLKREVETTYATTAILMDKVDAGNLNWKPGSGSNWMTVGQLLKHLTEGCGAGMRAFVTGDWGLPEGKSFEDLPPEEMFPPAEKLPAVTSVEQAKRLLLQDKTVALQMIDEAGEDDLCRKEIAAPWSAGKAFPLGWQLFQMVLHLDRHKSQLFYYLKLQGKAVGTVDLWG
jgi:DinB superfamily